jgi:hypothetical protein
MPTTAAILTVIGVFLQLPMVVLCVSQSIFRRPAAADAGFAALELLPTLVILVSLAVLGMLMNLGVGGWCFASKAGKKSGWNWMRWTTVVVLIGWAVLITLLMVLGS